MSIKLVTEIDDTSIGGAVDVNGTMKGMDINQLVEMLYKLAANVQVPIYINQKPENPVKGAIHIKITDN